MNYFVTFWAICTSFRVKNILLLAKIYFSDKVLHWITHQLVTLILMYKNWRTLDLDLSCFQRCSCCSSWVSPSTAWSRCSPAAGEPWPIRTRHLVTWPRPQLWLAAATPASAASSSSPSASSSSRSSQTSTSSRTPRRPQPSRRQKNSSPVLSYICNQ